MFRWLLLVFFCSSCIGAQNVLTIFAVYPSASALGISGSCCGLSWGQDTPMTQVNASTWSYQLTWDSSSVGNVLSYKIRLNGGAWQVGANAQLTFSESVTSATTFPWFGTQNGMYSVVGSLYSKQLKNSRSAIVYFPPSYFENTLKMYTNVLVMHDGQNLFNDSTSFGGLAWNIQNMLDPLITNGAMHEVLVIGLYNTPDRNDEYTYSVDPSEGFGGKGNLYLDFLEQTVVPWARTTLRIDSSVQKFSILGSSLGGLISCYAGYTRPYIWGKTGCMSSSFWWNSQDFNGTVLSKVEPPKKPKLFYIDTGSNEGDDPDEQVQNTLLVASTLNELGFKPSKDEFTYVIDGAQHNEYFWGKRFYLPMQVLFGINQQ